MAKDNGSYRDNRHHIEWVILANNFIKKSSFYPKNKEMFKLDGKWRISFLSAYSDENRLVESFSMLGSPKFRQNAREFKHSTQTQAVVKIMQFI